MSSKCRHCSEASHQLEADGKLSKHHSGSLRLCTGPEGTVLTAGAKSPAHAKPQETMPSQAESTPSSGHSELQAVPAQFRERIEPSCCLSENGVYLRSRSIHIASCTCQLPMAHPPEKCCNIRTVLLWKVGPSFICMSWRRNVHLAAGALRGNPTTSMILLRISSTVEASRFVDRLAFDQFCS